MATINNVGYSWSMIQLQTTIPGESEKAPILVDATAISWSAQRKMEYTYGLGGQPRKRGYGNITYEASITLPYGTQIELRTKGGGTLMGLGEFNLKVSWVNDLAANVTSEVVTLAGCTFTEGGFDANQDDTSLTKEFQLNPYRIYNDSVASNSKIGWGHEFYSK